MSGGDECRYESEHRHRGERERERAAVTRRDQSQGQMTRSQDASKNIPSQLRRMFHTICVWHAAEIWDFCLCLVVVGIAEHWLTSNCCWRKKKTVGEWA